MNIDYDRIAVDYARHRKVHPGVLQGLLQTSELSPDSAVLEVGCGTGNYILALQAASGCSSWGIDPSEQMLAFSRAHDTKVTFLQGYAEHLSFPSECFDLVFSVDVIHHVKQKERSIREAARVLKPGGRFCVVTEDETLIRTRIPAASYFPETVEPELARYPRLEDLIGWLQVAGFTAIAKEIVRQPYQITDLSADEAKAFSCLHLIPEDAFQRGLARLREDLKRGPIPAVSHYLLLWGQKPVDQSNQ